MFNKKFFIENFKTLFYAFIIAIIIRSLIIQPFYIPSSSMEPGLLVGDRLFVTKYSYGYSKHSFPFSPPIFENRIFSSKPNRGDVIVFKTPADNRTDYIKRLIGLPGDRIQFVDSNLYLNNSEILKSKVSERDTIYCGDKTINVFTFEEKLPNGKIYKTVYLKNFTFNDLDIIFLVLLLNLKYGLPKLSFKISTSLKFKPFLKPVPSALENDSFAANFFENI